MTVSVFLCIVNVCNTEVISYSPLAFTLWWYSFSRKVLWLEAGITNRRPEVIGSYFVKAAENEGGKFKYVH